MLHVRNIYIWVTGCDRSIFYQRTYGAKYGCLNIWANYNDLTVLPNICSMYGIFTNMCPT